MYVAMWIIVPEADEEPPPTGESSVGPS
jgi:hypothetical protein